MVRRIHFFVAWFGDCVVWVLCFVFGFGKDTRVAVDRTSAKEPRGDARGERQIGR